MRQPRSREDGYFLPPGDAVHAVDGRYAGLDHLLGVDPTLRVYGLTCDIRVIRIIVNPAKQGVVPPPASRTGFSSEVLLVRGVYGHHSDQTYSPIWFC